MKKILLKVMLLLTAVMMCLVATFVVAVFFMPEVDSGYNAVTIDKYRRLMSTAEPKIILVGGSNLAFGVDSARAERELGIPVVNLGVHAGLGVEFPVELAKSNIQQGDTVVLVLEYELYKDLTHSGELAWLAMGSHAELFYKCIKPRHYWDTMKALPIYVTRGIMSQAAPTEETAYSRLSFNEYGDNIFKRPHSVDRTDRDVTLEIGAQMVSDDVIDYLNGFSEYVNKKGAKVYISFPSISKAYISKTSKPEELREFLLNNINIPHLSIIEDYILEDTLFYDTYYHLNDEGVQIRTEQLIKDLNLIINP